MAITTRNQFSGGIKTLSNQGAKTRALIQELLITAVFYANADGDVAPVNRVVEAVSALKSMDMWKIHKWLKTYEAPVKPSADGKTYVFDKTKRVLDQNATREAFLPYETVMRQEPAWFELAKAEASPSSVWEAETGFENFIKKLEKEGYGEASTALKSTLDNLKRQGKLRKLAEAVAEQVGEATI